MRKIKMKNKFYELNIDTSIFFRKKIDENIILEILKRDLNIRINYAIYENLKEDQFFCNLIDKIIKEKSKYEKMMEDINVQIKFLNEDYRHCIIFNSMHKAKLIEQRIKYHENNKDHALEKINIYSNILDIIKNEFFKRHKLEFKKEI